jgi:hypothetical protein
MLMHNGVPDGPFAMQQSTTVLNQFSQSLSKGQVIEIPTEGLQQISKGRYPNEGAPNDLMQDWCIDGVWNSKLQQACVAGAPNSKLYDKGESSTLLNYNATKNQWSCYRNPWKKSIGHCYSSTAIDPEDGILYKAFFSASADCLRFDLNNNQSLPRLKGPQKNISRTSSRWDKVHGITWFPELGEKGSLVHVNSAYGRVNRWDKASKRWSSIAERLNIHAAEPLAHYQPNTQKVVIGSDGKSRLYLLDKAGEISPTDNAPCKFYPANCFVADPASSQSLVFADNKRVYPLDTNTGKWLKSFVLPALLKKQSRIILDTAAFSIAEHNVIMFEHYLSNGRSKVFLYRHS